jgi:hypothetical protein
MIRSISIISFVFICVLSCIIVSVPICPVYAAEQNVSNTKKTDKAVSQNARDESLKGNQQQEFITAKGLEYITTKKDPKPQGAGFIRLKPKLEDDVTAGSQTIFDVEFMNDEAPGHKTKKEPDGGPYMKFEKIEDPEKNNIMVRKATEKDYKTEVSMGLKMSPYSEIYLGRGFLVDRKDNFNVNPRDDGWRIKFKFDF